MRRFHEVRRVTRVKQSRLAGSALAELRSKHYLWQCFNTKARRTRRRELGLRRISVERQISAPVTYKNEVLDCCLKLDLLVTNSIIVEVKSVDKLRDLRAFV